LSQLSISFNIRDLLLVLTINNSKYKEEMINVTGKMAVMDYAPEINLSYVSQNLDYMHIDALTIFSINLSPIVKQEIFEVNVSPKITYIEIGVLSFIELMDTTSENLFLS
jgi:hypothetical protein